MENKVKLIKTNDGSSSLYNEELNETYHSRHGAVQEALHVFIDKGLLKAKTEFENIRLFEMGFGTGLNCLLTIVEMIKNPEISLQYSGLEKYPVSKELISNLTYGDINPKVFDQIHKADWNKKTQLYDNIELEKIQDDFESFSFPKEHFNLVYFDAFGPRAQSEMWQKKHFERIFNSMTWNGILVTYCAKGQVRRDLQDVGFTVERLEGPPGKREMLRAIKVNLNP